MNEDDTPNTSPVETPKKHSLHSALSTFLVIVATLFVAFSLTAFVFQSYEVSGPSMESTLHNGDRLIVVKANRTWARLTGHVYIPNRGDIIVFNKHGNVDISEDKHQKQLIKRVIGLPGERVVVQAGDVTVYNTEHPEGFHPDVSGIYKAQITPSTLGNTVDQTVPNGEVFVLGDNRGNSLDSRYFGTVSASDIIGVLKLRIYPPSQAQKF